MNPLKKSRIFRISILLMLSLLLPACSDKKTENSTDQETVYTVTFDLNGGTLVSGELEQQVSEGKAATAPQVEKKNYQLTWDRDFSNITSDIQVAAQWEKKELTSIEVAEIVQKSTVTINCEYYGGFTGSGSGFFIDDQGTIVTSYHVIEYATSINVETLDSGKHDVSTIVAFSELNDLAILKINMKDSPALAIHKDEVKVGETAYANGSALGILTGTFTSGTVSSTSRTVNGVSCIQMDAAISSGNSGGPLVNAYGEVIGVNALTYLDGENLNFAVKIENLDNLTDKVNYTVKEYEEWIMKETDRSYFVYYDVDDFDYSTVNTYTYVTGRDCIASVDFDGTEYEDYVNMCQFYKYEYVVSEADSYVEYLNSKGFKFQEREEFSDGVSYYYYNEWTEVMVDMFQSTDGYLMIYVYFF